jgi:hypothetical protein
MTATVCGRGAAKPMTRWGIAALVLCAAIGAAASAAKKGRDDARDTAAAHLPPGAVLEQAARGDFGPHRGGIILTYREGEGDGARYAGAGLVPTEAAVYRRVPLADIRQFDDLTVENTGIGTILFADLDGDRENEALILIKGMRRGPGGHSLMIVSVQDWKDGAFRALAPYELYFSDLCDSAVRVKGMIASLIQYRGGYVSKTPGVSADLRVDLADNGILTGTWNAVYGRAHTCDKLVFSVKPAGSRAELVRWSDGTGRDEVIGFMAASAGGAVVRFVRDLGEFDCGAGHPSEVRMKRK